MLRSVINEGTGGRVRRYGITADMGGKTGTTNDNSDSWFIDVYKRQRHRFIVRDAFRIGAFYDAVQFVLHSDFFLFNDFIVADNVQFYVRCYYCLLYTSRCV